jgi:hypothetical protein
MDKSSQSLDTERRDLVMKGQTRTSFNGKLPDELGRLVDPT